MAIAGFHVPVIPFVEVVGSAAGTAPPAQIFSEVPKLNAGVMFGLTVVVKVVATAHDPVAGVKV